MAPPPRRSQRSIAARQLLRDRLDRIQRAVDTYLAADDAVSTAETQREQTIARLDATIDEARTRRVAALATATGSNEQAAELAGVPLRAVRDARRDTGSDGPRDTNSAPMPAVRADTAVAAAGVGAASGGGEPLDG